MAKVFTITHGLENMGAMKTGGQGSVYKGRRIGEIITAVKLLPTPIYNESAEDKNFRDFQNEVQKLKKVNEKPNPNVVKIVSSGLSETGNFPFIEMEYIEGPDLEELLKPPHDPVFTIKEVIKVAEQLSNALAHCHQFDVRHGDIKSNNVKFNLHTGNYVLLDFGLAVMSEEQRRTSLRQAGAVEFMAPEQNEGQMLFQTDVYSFGVVLFELLAGKVPFPLQDKGETARNAVRLAHMDTLPPDVISLRKEAMPLTWSQEKRAVEIDIPNWLISTIYKCLKKKPENRFSNGIELHEYIVHQSINALDTGNAAETDAASLAKQQLQEQLVQYRHQLSLKEKEFEELRTKVANNETEVQLLREREDIDTSTEGVAKSSFIALLFLAVALAAFSAYSYFKHNVTQKRVISRPITEKTSSTRVTSSAKNKPAQKKKNKTDNKRNATDTEISNKNSGSLTKNSSQRSVSETKENADNNNPGKRAKSSLKYKVISQAYFYNTPDESSRRQAYINHWNNALLSPSDDMNGFIYIVYTNEKGQTSRGWLRKKDLTPVNE